MKLQIAAVALLLASVSSAHAQQDSALVYETTIRTSMMFGMSGESVVRTRTVESALGIREELVERSGPLSSGSDPFLKHSGSYTLRLASGGFYLIDPEGHEYSSMDDAVKDFLGDSAKMSAAVETFMGKVGGQSHSEADSLGEGDAILGQPTAHWRIHDATRLSMKSGNDSIITGSDLTTDAYFSTSIPRLAPASIRALKFGEDAKKKLPQTLALKSITKGTMSVPGTTLPMQVSMEVTQVSKRRLDPSLFEVPPGYKKVEMPILPSPQSDQ